jgi:hypothetical protein
LSLTEFGLDTVKSNRVVKLLPQLRQQELHICALSHFDKVLRIVDESREISASASIFAFPLALANERMHVKETENEMKLISNKSHNIKTIKLGTS